MVERAVSTWEGVERERLGVVTDIVKTDAEFKAYVGFTSHRLFRLAYLLEGTAAEAEDLVQDTLLRTLRSWPRIRAADDVDRYVHRIMINLHRSRLRRLRLAVTPDRSRVGLRDEMATVEDRWDLAQALRSLPRGQCQVVVLRYFLDTSEERTAEILGCSVGTVKHQAAKARTKLQQHPALIQASDDGSEKGT